MKFLKGVLIDQSKSALIVLQRSVPLFLNVLEFQPKSQTAQEVSTISDVKFPTLRGINLVGYSLVIDLGTSKLEDPH